MELTANTGSTASMVLIASTVLATNILLVTRVRINLSALNSAVLMNFVRNVERSIIAPDSATSAVRSATFMRRVQVVGQITSLITRMASATSVVQNAIVTSIVTNVITLTPMMASAIDVKRNVLMINVAKSAARTAI
jgi:hypothetical protein